MKVLNLTQHAPTADQVAAGVYDHPDRATEVARLLTFDALPTLEEIRQRAESLSWLAHEARPVGPKGTFDGDAVMIGGAPWLMAPLITALRLRGLRPVFAFSVRESVEETLPDGSVRKSAVFRHCGFVEAV